MTSHFREKLEHALLAADLSRSRLSKLAGVDKSVASRWVSGATRPSEANLEALTRVLATTLTGLRLADWALPLDEFKRKFVLAPTTDTESAERPATIPTGRPSIAVLPFANVSSDAEQDAFGEGVAEDILTALSKLRWLTVRSRHASFYHHGPNVDMRVVSSDLDVRYILHGSIRRAGPRVRVTAQLSDARAGSQVWADRYDRDWSDIFALQDDIVASVIAAIGPAIVDAERQRAFSKPTKNLDAWEAYQRGLWHHSKRTFADVETAKSFFRQAIDRDPNFAPPHLGLALTHITDAIVFHTADYDASVAAAERSIRQAQALDESNINARTQLGHVYRLQGHIDAALREADLVLAAAPGTADALGLKGVTLVSAGRHVEARETLEAALRLGPRDPRRGVWRVHIVHAHYFAGDDAAAYTEACDVLREFPSYPSALVAMASVCGQLGKRDEAEAALATYDRVSKAGRAALGIRRPVLSVADHARRLDGLRKAGWQG